MNKKINREVATADKLNLTDAEKTLFDSYGAAFCACEGSSAEKKALKPQLSTVVAKNRDMFERGVLIGNHLFTARWTLALEATEVQR